MAPSLMSPSGVSVFQNSGNESLQDEENDVHGGGAESDSDGSSVTSGLLDNDASSVEGAAMRPPQTRPSTPPQRPKAHILGISDSPVDASESPRGMTLGEVLACTPARMRQTTWHAAQPSPLRQSSSMMSEM